MQWSVDGCFAYCSIAEFANIVLNANGVGIVGTVKDGRKTEQAGTHAVLLGYLRQEMLNQTCSQTSKTLIECITHSGHTGTIDLEEQILQDKFNTSWVYCNS